MPTPEVLSVPAGWRPRALAQSANCSGAPWALQSHIHCNHGRVPVVGVLYPSSPIMLTMCERRCIANECDMPHACNIDLNALQSCGRAECHAAAYWYLTHATNFCTSISSALKPTSEPCALNGTMLGKELLSGLWVRPEAVATAAFHLRSFSPPVSPFPFSPLRCDPASSVFAS